MHTGTCKISKLQPRGISRKKRKEGGELCLDWDRSYLAPMKYCLRFEEETSTLLLGTEQALQLLDCLFVTLLRASQFKHSLKNIFLWGALALIAPPPPPPPPPQIRPGVPMASHNYDSPRIISVCTLCHQGSILYNASFMAA